MDALHAVIATYLREHNGRIMTPSSSPVPYGEVPRCRRCSWPILTGDGVFPLARLRAARLCAHCTREDLRAWRAAG
jgi:hypothetical protein